MFTPLPSPPTDTSFTFALTRTSSNIETKMLVSGIVPQICESYQRICSCITNYVFHTLCWIFKEAGLTFRHIWHKLVCFRHIKAEGFMRLSLKSAWTFTEMQIVKKGNELGVIQNPQSRSFMESLIIGEEKIKGSDWQVKCLCEEKTELRSKALSLLAHLFFFLSH